MKKTYVAPSVENIKVNAVNMLAASIRMNDTEVDTSEGGVQLGREDKSGNTNIWDQGW